MRIQILYPVFLTCFFDIFVFLFFIFLFFLIRIGKFYGKENKLQIKNDFSSFYIYVHAFIESVLARKVCLVIKYILGGEF